MVCKHCGCWMKGNSCAPLQERKCNEHCVLDAAVGLFANNDLLRLEWKLLAGRCLQTQEGLIFQHEWLRGEYSSPSLLETRHVVVRLKESSFQRPGRDEYFPSSPLSHSFLPWNDRQRQELPWFETQIAQLWKRLVCPWGAEDHKWLRSYYPALPLRDCMIPRFERTLSAKTVERVRESDAKECRRASKCASHWNSSMAWWHNQKSSRPSGRCMAAWGLESRPHYHCHSQIHYCYGSARNSTLMSCYYWLVRYYSPCHCLKCWRRQMSPRLWSPRTHSHCSSHSMNCTSRCHHCQTKTRHCRVRRLHRHIRHFDWGHCRHPRRSQRRIRLVKPECNQNIGMWCRKEIVREIKGNVEKERHLM